MQYGYARVSTVAQSYKYGLDVQVQQLIDAGVPKENIYCDAYTGTKQSRPEWDKLLARIQANDTLVVCKLDRIARSAINGLEVVQELLKRDIDVHILNMGHLNNSPMGKMMMTMFFGFAEFERDMIVERCQAGRAEARRNNPDYRDGGKPKFTSAQRNHAMELLDSGKSFTEVSRLTGISVSTLTRERRRRKAEEVHITVRRSE